MSKVYLVLQLPENLKLNEQESLVMVQLGFIRALNAKRARKLMNKAIVSKIYPENVILIPFGIDLTASKA